jgi:hypothetical protein
MEGMKMGLNPQIQQAQNQTTAANMAARKFRNDPDSKNEARVVVISFPDPKKKNDIKNVVVRPLETVEIDGKTMLAIEACPKIEMKGVMKNPALEFLKKLTDVTDEKAATEE